MSTYLKIQIDLFPDFHLKCTLSDNDILAHLLKNQSIVTIVDKYAVFLFKLS